MDKLLHQFNLELVAAWFGASLTCLIFAILFSFYLSNPRFVQHSSQSFKLYASIPPGVSEISENFTTADARSILIENLFKQHNSPLAEYGGLFVTVADKYELDYRLLPSIAMQESKGGKKVIAQSYNPFGFGIYEDNVIKFSSWEEAIEKVGKSLKENYLNKGLRTPSEIMIKYTPSSLAKGGSWAKGVTFFMEGLQ